MKIITFLLIVILSLGLKADPYVGAVYPAGIQIGETNRLIVVGQGFWKIQGVDLGEGVEVVHYENVPGFSPPPGDQRKYLVTWLDQIAKGDRTQPRLPVENEHYSEWRSNRWWSVLGTLDTLQLSLVEHYLYTPRNSLQMSPALSQKMLVTVYVPPTIKPGKRALRVYGVAGGMSPPRPVLLTAAPHFQEPLYVPPHRPKPETVCVTNFPCWLDGQIMPGSTDVWKVPLKAGEVVTFRTVAREFAPYIGDAVPGFFNPVLRIVNEKGKEVAFADDYFYHPDPVLVFRAQKSQTFTLEIHDNLYRGRDDFVYTIQVEKGKDRPNLDTLSLFPLPKYEIPANTIIAAFTGVLSKPGKENVHTFEITEPTEVVFDLLARRVGSPLDARLDIYLKQKNTDVVNSDNEVNIGPSQVATDASVLSETQSLHLTDVTNKIHCGSVIQAECDPVGKVMLSTPGIYEVRVSDETKHGGNDYRYNLRIHKPAPRFEVWARSSGMVMRSWGGTAPVAFDIIRHDGFEGEITLEANDLVAFRNPIIPATSNRWNAVMRSRFQEPFASTNFTLYAHALIGGETNRVMVVPANEYNQAFAWNHLVPTENFCLHGLKGTPPKPPKKQKNKQQKKK